MSAFTNKVAVITAVVHPGDDLPEGTLVDPVRQRPVAQ